MTKGMNRWSVFQSPQVREILLHLTPEETAALKRRSGGYGIWCGITAAAPLSFAIVAPGPLNIALAAMLGIVHLSFIPVWMERQRNFLASTVWATEHGIKPQDLKRFALRG